MVALYFTLNRRAAQRSGEAAERSARSTEGVERSAALQAEAAKTQAAAERELAIERERFHQERTPILDGCAKRRPYWRVA